MMTRGGDKEGAEVRTKKRGGGEIMGTNEATRKEWLEQRKGKRVHVSRKEGAMKREGTHQNQKP
jgi:hypothetical protein